MTIAAITHTFKKIALPTGRALWLYGDMALAQGDVYSPWYDAKRLVPSTKCTFHSDIQTLGRDYDAVILNGTKQQAETEGLLALAMERSKGFVMAVAPKDAGGGRLIDMMESYGMPFDTLSKDRCRVVWTFDAAKAKRTIIQENISNLSPRLVTMDDGAYFSMPGLFGWDKIDEGSKTLLQHLPSDLSGKVADFGCGYGYLSINLARQYPAITNVDAYDADARAVACTTRNGGEKVHAHWLDIRNLSHQKRYDAIVMNPPFHSGKQEDIDLGETFIRTAWENLKTGGRLFFVANRHLPYEKIVPGLTILHEDTRYKIITVRRA